VERGKDSSAATSLMEMVKIERRFSSPSARIPLEFKREFALGARIRTFFQP